MPDLNPDEAGREARLSADEAIRTRSSTGARPFLGRRRKIGWDMYGLIGVNKGDFEGTERHRLRNYEFFGSPVGMMAAFADMHTIIRSTLGIPANEIIVCGFALGHADPDAAINRLVTERAPPAEFATFDGF
jgi:hypothetical protein